MSSTWGDRLAAGKHRQYPSPAVGDVKHVIDDAQRVNREVTDQPRQVERSERLQATARGPDEAAVNPAISILSQN
jgi:hypothetical protein